MKSRRADREEGAGYRQSYSLTERIGEGDLRYRLCEIWQGVVRSLTFFGYRDVESFGKPVCRYFIAVEHLIDDVPVFCKGQFKGVVKLELVFVGVDVIAPEVEHRDDGSGW